jgi:hypothetical protein
MVFGRSLLHRFIAQESASLIDIDNEAMLFVVFYKGLSDGPATAQTGIAWPAYRRCPVMAGWQP